MAAVACCCRVLTIGCLQTGLIDYDKLQERALDFRPKMIICGGSAYPRDWDYKRLYDIAQKTGAYLLCDMAHIRQAPCTVIILAVQESSGLVMHSSVQK